MTSLPSLAGGIVVGFLAILALVSIYAAAVSLREGERAAALKLLAARADDFLYGKKPKPKPAPAWMKTSSNK